MFEVWLNFSNFYPMNTSIFLKLHAPILFFLEPKQTHHQHYSININIMPTIALLNKEILACGELYLNPNVEANLDSFLLGKVKALPRNGRTNYEVEWDPESINR